MHIGRGSTVDRKIFKFPFEKQGITKFTCPECNKGLLRVKKDTFHHKETRASSKAKHYEEWEPEWIEYIFSCLFECTNSACKDTVSCSGIGFVSEEYFYNENGEPDRDYQDLFRPKYFTPHLKLFSLPAKTPEDIATEIFNSFSLFFSDPSSSANHIRIALEHLLTYLKIKRFTTKNGKRHYLALHNRIELLPQKFDHVKDIFIAIKWLGNAGSHSNHQITMDDVLDSYELMDELLVEIFSNTRGKAKTLAKKIIKKKGPK